MTKLGIHALTDPNIPVAMPQVRVPLMRFKHKQDSDCVVAVSGVNTVSFGILASAATRKGLLGFAVERIDPAEQQRYFMYGFKVFQSVVPTPAESTQVSTFDHPVQSFIWDDFTAKPDRDYTYLFYPIKGTPKNLDRSAKPVQIDIRTEPLFSEETHDIFFNRGVASSQAYTRRFGSGAIDTLSPEKRTAAIDWLSRDLDEAILRFIVGCGPGDRLLCCFYEFRYEPVARALASAIKRGVDVRLIIDAKQNERQAAGKTIGAFPREANLALLKKVRIPVERIIKREARTSAIQHNKFMVRIPKGGNPTEVWTGSTNISLGGIAGQTNVGHWVRDASIAQIYVTYWELLADDPGGTDNDTTVQVRVKNKQFRTDVETISPVPSDLHSVPRGVTPVFSPRLSTSVLGSYAELLDSTKRQGCITLAFGVGTAFKDLLQDNTAANGLVFMLLEKRDAPNPRSKNAFVRIDRSNNVYTAWGSFVENPVYHWARETNAGLLGLNRHVSYIHSKFMLVEPLSADPIVVTGSANFSDPSTKENDENMLVIRGDTRVADIYLTEFNRLFIHYYFRSVYEDLARTDRIANGSNIFLDETDKWQSKYKQGSFRSKRLALFDSMVVGQTI
ncbi:phospholipase D-like domain-containing protein [Rhodococcus sp. IEGM 1330]|uniref:phospholipase D-like domain-containing protein n=1 Tax=Rhodococcus sp. IEGM 1330 TaxID=3082225 RepID=UPI0029539306|nr:phospholipase D-like domain-containing protein [Rhodococcus sp. IEGM 1330]MDV8022203.1 phospholipase D-like domain-containing protein [Rhodococcus sp. IEGM 1330]